MPEKNTSLRMQKASRKPNRPPSERIAEAIVNLSLGELTKLARILNTRDNDTATFLYEKLGAEVRSL